jgi:hypothetical protein
VITKKAATGAVLAAAVLWLAAPAAADGLPRLVLCDDFAEVDPAQVSFCIEDAQGAVLGGGVSPTAEALPTVVADPDAPGGWGLTFPEGWAGTAVMTAPPLVAPSPPAASAAPAPPPASAAPRAASPATSQAVPVPTPEPAAALDPVPVPAAPPLESPPADAPPAAPTVDAGPETNLAAEDAAAAESSALRWLGAAALLASAAAAALGLRRRGARTGAGEMGGAEGI